MSMLYNSHRLPTASKYVRVLDVLGVPASAPDEPIQGRLRVIPLDGSQKFTALSYVWGSYAATPQYITCDGTRLNVTSNCHSALGHMRNTLGTFTIWIDAVCINQEDEPEKMAQIPLMGDIYSIAETVYIWLGDGTPGTDRAMDYMSNPVLARYYTPQADGTAESSPFFAAWFLYWSKFNIKKHPIPFSSLTPTPKPRFGGHYLYATFQDLQDLLCRPWIERLWTYQEILLAANPVMVCGNRYVPWNTFELSLCFLDNAVSFNSKGITEPWVNLGLNRERLQTSNLALQSSQSTALESYITFVEQVWRRMDMIDRVLQVSGLYFILGSLALLTVEVYSKKSLLFLVLLLPISLLTGWLLVEILIIKRRYKNVARTGYVDASTSNEMKHFSGVPRWLRIEGFTLTLYSRSAKEPKDMAFGMWAVLERGGALNLPTPDSSLSLGYVYSTFARHLVYITRRADLILLAAVKGVDGQPSWVPDWSAHGTNEWGDHVAEIDISDDAGGSYSSHNADPKKFVPDGNPEVPKDANGGLRSFGTSDSHRESAHYAQSRVFGLSHTSRYPRETNYWPSRIQFSDVRTAVAQGGKECNNVTVWKSELQELGFFLSEECSEEPSRGLDSPAKRPAYTGGAGWVMQPSLVEE
ncbi:heterokaryon incompatibility protein-domain-containing protein [Apiospora sp. TS-2023a]